MDSPSRFFGAIPLCLALVGCAAAEGRVEHAESAPPPAQPAAAATLEEGASPMEQASPASPITPLTVAVALTTTEDPEPRKLPGATPLAPRDCTGSGGVVAVTMDSKSGVAFGSSLQGARFRACPRGSQSLFDVTDSVAGVPVMRGYAPHFRLDW